MEKKKIGLPKIGDVNIRYENIDNLSAYSNVTKIEAFTHWDDDIYSGILAKYIGLVKRENNYIEEKPATNADSTMQASTSSDFRIGKDGSLFENWTSAETIPAKLIEVNNDYIILECLVDSANKVFQTRKFEKSFLPENIDLKVDLILFLKIFKRPGKTVFELIESPSSEFEKYFATDSEEYKEIKVGKYIK